MRRLAALLLFAITLPADAIVVRHDVDDARYRTDAGEFPALVDMPGEGHGVLIDPQWVLTAAHVLPHHAIASVVVGGEARAVERIVVHPGYSGPPPAAMIEQALAAGDAKPIVDFLAASDDIALVKLAAPVTDVAPVMIYRDANEAGRLIKLVGKGGTGTGVDGMGQHSPHRTELRRAFNTIDLADGRWLDYTFDQGPSAHALEGTGGDGDSGGPLLVELDGQWFVAGLGSFKRKLGEGCGFRSGCYGQTSVAVRVSHYATWINVETASEAPWTDR